jgi:ribosome-associated protein
MKKKAKTKVKKTAARKTTPKKPLKKILNPKGLAALVAEAASDKKAEEIKVMDLRGKSALTDHVVICTAEAGPHIDAICDNIDEKIRSTGRKAPRWDGKRGSDWKVMDAGSVIVHVMCREQRQHYNIDELFEKGAIIYHL